MTQENNLLAEEQQWFLPEPESEFDGLELREGSRLLTQVHLNYNLLASVGIKVTNFDPIGGQIVNFAILPLRPDYTAYQELSFVDMWIKPFRQQGSDPEQDSTVIGGGLDVYKKARSIGVDPSLAADLLVH